MIQKPSTCELCAMYKKGRAFVPLTLVALQAKPRLLIQGEAPGQDEADDGQAFVGRAGTVLKYKVLPLAGVKAEQCAFDNTLRCQPPDNKYPVGKDRTSAELCCRQYDSWHKFPLDVPLLCVGGKAGKMYLGSEAVTDYHGHIESINGRLTGFTLHPSYVARLPNLMPVIVRETSNLLQASRNPDVLTRPAVYKGGLPYHDGAMVFDLEWADKINVVGVAYNGREAFSSFDVEPSIDVINRHINEGNRIGGHNIIDADLPMLGMQPKSWHQDKVFDTMIVAHLVHAHLAGSGFLDLGGLVRYYFPTPDWKREKADLLQYNGLDCAYNYRLYEALCDDLTITDQWHLVEPQQELARLCHMMGRTGVRINVDELKKLVEARKIEQDALLKELPINPNSVPQIKKFAREQGIKIADAQYETLQRQKGKSPEFDKLIQYREDIKSISTWFPYEEDDDGNFVAADERLYPSFNPTGTEVARLSSSGPNFQNIPPHLRYLILPDREDEELVAFDAKQIENRTVSWIAGDHEALESWKQYDPYRYVASLIFNKRYEDVTPDERALGKTTELATIYCESEHNLATRLFGNRKRDSVAQARRLQAQYYAARPKIRVWQQQIERQMERQEIQLRNPYGRVRFVYTHSVRESLKRGCHYLGCSTAAQTVNLRAVWIWKELKLVPKLIVHDEIWWSVPRGDSKLVERIIEILHEPVKEMNGLVVPWERKEYKR